MRRSARAVAIGFVAAMLATMAVPASPAGAAACERPSITVRFLNGIDNSHDQSLSARRALQRIYGTTTGSGTPVRYDLLYNPTHGPVVDVLEVVQQKLNERIEAGILTVDTVQRIVDRLTSAAIDASTAPARTLARFIAALGVPRVSDAARNIGAELAGLSDAFDVFSARQRELVRRAFEAFNDEATLPGETRDVIDEHVATVRQDLALGANVLIVAHSQGNLFAAVEYRHLVGDGADPARLHVEHVASAASLLAGPYVTADTDMVINVLLPLIAEAAPPNVTLPIFRFGSNHGFVDAYLQRGYPPRARIDADMAAHFSALAAPATAGGPRAIGRPGWFDHPLDVALSPSERYLYVADRGNRLQAVDRVDREVRTVVDAAPLDRISHLAVDAAGNVYASGRRTPTGGGRIVRFDRSDHFRSTVVTDLTVADAPIAVVDGVLVSAAQAPDAYGLYQHLVSVPLDGSPLVDLRRPAYFRDGSIDSSIDEIADAGGGHLLVVVGGTYTEGRLFYEPALWRYDGDLTTSPAGSGFSSPAFVRLSGHMKLQRLATDGDMVVGAGGNAVREVTHGFSVDHGYYPWGEWTGNAVDHPAGAIPDEQGMRLLLGDRDGYSGSGVGELHQVGGIVVNRQHVLYTADTDNDRVVRVGTQVCAA